MQSPGRKSFDPHLEVLNAELLIPGKIITVQTVLVFSRI